MVKIIGFLNDELVLFKNDYQQQWTPTPEKYELDQPVSLYQRLKKLTRNRNIEDGFDIGSLIFGVFIGFLIGVAFFWKVYL